eukprot:10229308-Ditylum_brightwellii.AAC.1
MKKEDDIMPHLRELDHDLPDNKDNESSKVKRKMDILNKKVWTPNSLNFSTCQVHGLWPRYQTRTIKVV